MYNRLLVHIPQFSWFTFVPFYGWVMYHCIYVPSFFIHSSVDGYLRCVHVLAIINSDAMNTGVHVSWIAVYSGHMPSSGIAGSYDALGLPRWLNGEESTCQCRRRRRCRSDPWVRKIPWRRKQQPTPVFLPGESHGPRSLAGCSPGVRKESYMTEQLSTHKENWSGG